jgi:hypothetical protein
VFLAFFDHQVRLKGYRSRTLNVTAQESINETLRLHKQLAGKLVAAGHPLPAAPATSSTPWFEDATGHPLAWNAAAAARASPDAPLDLIELLDVSRRTGVLYRQDTLGKTSAGLQVAAACVCVCVFPRVFTCVHVSWFGHTSTCHPNM